MLLHMGSHRNDPRTHHAARCYDIIMETSLFVQVSGDETRDHIEVCPVAGQTMQEVAHRIQQHGGFGLFVDYGHTGEKGDTFRVGRSFLFLIVNMCTGRLLVTDVCLLTNNLR